MSVSLSTLVVSSNTRFLSSVSGSLDCPTLVCVRLACCIFPCEFGVICDSASSKRGVLTGSRCCFEGIGGCGPDAMLDSRFRASARCSYAHIKAMNGRCVAFSIIIRRLLSRSEGKTRRSGRRNSGIRFFQSVSLAHCTPLFRKMLRGQVGAHEETPASSP